MDPDSGGKNLRRKKLKNARKLEVIEILLHKFKGIVSRDFRCLQMILQNSGKCMGPWTWLRWMLFLRACQKPFYGRV